MRGRGEYPVLRWVLYQADSVALDVSRLEIGVPKSCEQPARSLAMSLAKRATGWPLGPNLAPNH